MDRLTNKNTPYYCMFCKEHSYTNNHSLCYEFKLFCLREEQEKLSTAFDIIERMIDIIETYHEDNMVLDNPSYFADNADKSPIAE
jgi:hypothetical protein